MTDNVIPLVTRAVVETPPPEFIQPHDIRSMSDEQLEAMLEGIRKRRLEAVEKHQRALEDRKGEQRVKVQLRLDKKLGQVEKQVLAVDKALQKLEQVIFDYRALRLQLED